MGSRLLVTLGALALTLTAAGCGVQQDPPAPPARSAGSGTGTAAAVPSTTVASTAGASPATSPTLIAFVMVVSAGTSGASEVSGPDQIDRLAGGPPAALEPVRAAVARHSGPGTRLFGFVLAGCQNTGATLAIQGDRITAALTGGEGIACFAVEWFLAVFAVPAGVVPPGARVG